jgi:hypothetical protein
MKAVAYDAGAVASSVSYENCGSSDATISRTCFALTVPRPAPVVLEKSNMETLALYLYLLVHSLRQEDHYDTDDASAGEIYPILVSKSTVSAVQSARRRQPRASVVDRHTPTHRTAALHGMRPGSSPTGKAR